MKQHSIRIFIEKSRWLIAVIAATLFLAVTIQYIAAKDYERAVYAFIMTVLAAFTANAEYKCYEQRNQVKRLQRLLSERERIMKSLSDKVSDLMRQIKKKKYNKQNTVK
jgi:predicted membrane metal-binding protein